MPCDTPFYVNRSGDPGHYVDKTGSAVNNARSHHIPVPCGKCPDCKMRRVREWCFRIRQEARLSIGNYFVTLTYDNDNVPRTPNGFLTLDKSDPSGFLKRLRSRIDGAYKFKFYLAGEYGESRTHGRPHYHIIFMNVRSDHVRFFDLCWQKGLVHIDEVNRASIQYTLKYIDKEKSVPLHKNDDRVPEYSSMSRYIGHSYLTPKNISWHKADLSRTYVVTEEGWKVPMPRYYKQRIYTEFELLKIRDLAKASQEDREEEMIRRYNKHYGGRQDYSYDTWKESIIYQKHSEFYKNQKLRDYGSPESV